MANQPDFDPVRERAFLRVVDQRLEEAQNLHLWATTHLSPSARADASPGLIALIHELMHLRENCRRNLSLDR